MHSLPRQLSYRVRDLRRVIALGKETAALREVVLAYQIMAEVIILMGGERLLTAFLH